MTREDKGVRTGGGRQTVSAALALVLILFFLPVLALRGEPVYRRPGTGELPNGEAVLPADPTAGPGAGGAAAEQGRDGGGADHGGLHLGGGGGGDARRF